MNSLYLRSAKIILALFFITLPLLTGQISSAYAACSSSISSSTFSVFDSSGTININSCNITIHQDNNYSLNVASDKLSGANCSNQMPKACNGSFCEASENYAQAINLPDMPDFSQATASVTYTSSSNYQLTLNDSGRTHTVSEPSNSAQSISYTSGDQTLTNGDYYELKVKNNVTFKFNYDPDQPAYNINKLTIWGQATLIFEPGDYFIHNGISLSTNYNFSFKVQGTGDGSGSVRIHTDYAKLQLSKHTFSYAEDEQYLMINSAIMPKKDDYLLTLSNEIREYNQHLDFQNRDKTSVIYDTITLNNAPQIFLKIDTAQVANEEDIFSPFYIENLLVSGGSGGTYNFSAGDFFIYQMNTSSNNKSIIVTEDQGNTSEGNEARLYIYKAKNSTDLSLQNYRFNADGTSSEAKKAAAENLSLFLYTGNLSIKASTEFAGLAYIAEGSFKSSASTPSFYGQIAAQAINLSNTGNFYFTDVATDLYGGTDTGADASISGEYSASSPAFPLNAKTGDYVYIASQIDEQDSVAGFLKAYRLNNDGSSTNSASWDAADMRVADRSSIGTSSKPSGLRTSASINENKKTIPLSDLDQDDLAVVSSTEAKVILNYTFEPNYNNGDYLAGRDQNSVLGRPHITQPKVLDPPQDSALLLSDADYVDFAKQQASRPRAVLFAADDGFLYAIDPDNKGKLLWAWMPYPLVDELHDYANFYQEHPFEGQFELVDAKDSANNFATYIVGTAQSGAITFALKLADSETAGHYLDSSRAQVWLDHVENAQRPNNAAPTIWRNGKLALAVYITNSNNESTIYFRDISSGKASHFVKTPGNNNLFASSPVIATLSDNSTVLFAGDSAGNITQYKITASDDSRPSNLSSLSDVGNIGGDTDVIENVSHIKHINYNNRDYLLAQSSNRATVFTYSDDTWQKVWTVEDSQAGKWNDTVYESSKEITPFDSGSRITAASSVEAGIVFIPITTANSQSCQDEAWLYFYSLGDGSYPSGQLNSQGTTLTGKLQLGIGEAKTPITAEVDEQFMIHGHSEQNLSNSDAEPSPDGVDNPILIQGVAFNEGGTNWRIVND